MSQFATAVAPMPPSAPPQASVYHASSAMGGRPTQVPLVPQIAPWTQYMRKPGQAPVLPSIHANSQRPPAISTVSAPVPTSSSASGSIATKRHNPYAAASEGSSTITSPALGFTAAGKSPNTISFDRLPNNNATATAGIHPNNNSITNSHERSGSSYGGGREGRATAAHAFGHHAGFGSSVSPSFGYQHNRDATVGNTAQQGRGHGGDRAGVNKVVSVEELRQQRGSLLDLAHTANGSVFLQNAIRGTNAETAECIEIISAELLPHLGDLLLDSHGCYIIKTLMERMPVDQLQRVLDAQIAPDESLVYSLCTHSLHTRRVVQFLFDTIDCTLLIDTISTRCSEIATTQQGCIVVQRAMDVAVGGQRTRLFAIVQSHFNTFCFDPFANYVLQHMFTVGESGEVARGVWSQIKGSVVSLSCNKFASNVVEKCLSKFPADLQHEVLREMYDVSEERLLGMLQDSFGNYIVQTSIALAPQKEIPFMRAKLMAVLDRTPYGHKIESRLERRRKVNTKGESVAAEVPSAPSAIRSQSDSTSRQSHAEYGQRQLDAAQQRPQHQGHKGRPARPVAPIAPVAPVAEGEEPW